jgi:alkanesulfonate monooxygenase SsuD/methylene tetrahydromethanopterin reductase-like flavin-dependent oxidoreductase (luciferase family)
MDFAERAARNEEVFRSVNEHIEKAAERHGRDVPLRFHCECGRASCFETIDLMPDAYERVSAHRYRFIVLTGHEERAIERIVEQHDGWLVVEKVGEAREQIDRERSEGG